MAHDTGTMPDVPTPDIAAVVRAVVAETYGKATRVVVRAEGVELELDLLLPLAGVSDDATPAMPDPLEELNERFQRMERRGDL